MTPQCTPMSQCSTPFILSASRRGMATLPPSSQKAPLSLLEKNWRRHPKETCRESSSPLNPAWEKWIEKSFDHTHVIMHYPDPLTTSNHPDTFTYTCQQWPIPKKIAAALCETQKPDAILTKDDLRLSHLSVTQVIPRAYKEKAIIVHEP